MISKTIGFRVVHNIFRHTQNENTHCSSSLSFTPRRFCKSSEKAQGLSSTCLRGNGVEKWCIPPKKSCRYWFVLIAETMIVDSRWGFKGAKFQTSPNHTNHNHKDIRISSDLKKLPGLGFFFRDAEGIAWAFSGASHGVYDSVVRLVLGSKWIDRQMHHTSIWTWH